MVRRRTHLRITALAAVLVAMVVPCWTPTSPSATVQSAISTPSTLGWDSPSPLSPTPAVSSTSASPSVAPSQPTVTDKPDARPGCTFYGFASGDRSAKRTWREGKDGMTMHGFLNRTEPANC
jgi:hypothetical protein